MAVVITVGKIVDLLLRTPHEMLVTIYRLLEKMIGDDKKLWHENLEQFLKMEFGSNNLRPVLVRFPGDERSGGDPSLNFEVFILKRNENFRTMFESLGKENLKLLCLTKEKREHFVHHYPGWLRDEGYGTFFLSEKNGEFFVTVVRLYKDGPKSHDYPLSHKHVWPSEGRYRVVVPAVFSL